jgi:hypothetical protein
MRKLTDPGVCGCFTGILINYYDYYDYYDCYDDKNEEVD